MIVTGQCPVSDELAPRLSDGGKARDQSPVRRLLGGSSLQQLQQHLTRRSSSPLGRPTVTTSVVASSPRSPPASPVRVSAADVGLAWPKRTPSPACETQLAVGVSAAPAAAVSTTSACDQPNPQAMLLGHSATAALQPSPVVIVPEAAAVTAEESSASLGQALAGKRKFLEGTNSTELLHEAHVKSPQHTYDNGYQQQQADDSMQWHRDQQQQQHAALPPEDVSPFVVQGVAQVQHQQQEALLHQGSSSPELQQQQQQRGREPPAGSTSPPSGRQSSSPGPTGSGGDMKPPSLVDMARRVLGCRPELFGPLDSPGSAKAGNSRKQGPVLRRSQSGNAAATPTAGMSLGAPLRTCSHDVSMAAAAAASMATASMNTVSSQDGVEGGGAAPVSSLHSEPSLNMVQQPLPRALSSAASLEMWLGPGSRTTSGSPKSMTAAQQALLRTNSSMSTGSGQGSGQVSGQVSGQGITNRQGSLVLGQPLASMSSLGALDKQASFAGWPDGEGQVQQPTSAAAVRRENSFVWPAVPPMRTISEDSLKLDIQMMPAVVPEEYPPEPPAVAMQHDGHLMALQAQQQREQVDRAFFAKVAAWEDELVAMLERQAVPVAIRNIVAVFKDRIHTERDKSEFKALCDKWTGVVEFPAGSGVKCLAIKRWMRGTHMHPQHHHDDDDDDDVGDWDD